MIDLSQKKILIVGMGSAGKRHAKAAKDLNACVSTYSRRQDVGDFHDMVTALSANDWDLVIIANETSEHHQSLKQLVDAHFSGKVLIEKPLVNHIEEVKSVSHLENVSVAYNLRFHPVIQHVKDWLSRRDGHVVGASFYVGQDLSSWRPTRHLEETYSSQKSLGGGVLRDLSHELDLALWLLGPVSRVTSLGGRVSDITIDSDDYWNILSIHEKCPNVTVHLNYLDHPAKRQLKLWTASETLEVDFLTGKLQEGPDYVHLPMDSMMSSYDQLAAIFNNQIDVCSLDQASQVMHYINAIEKAANDACWVEMGGMG